jgi:hypothetical protein
MAGKGRQTPRKPKKMTPANKTKKARNKIDEICERVKELLRGFTDEELGWLVFDVDNPDPTERKKEQAREVIEGGRLRNREWTIDWLSDAVFDFGITEEPTQELSRWLEDKESVRAFLLERRL